MPSLAIREYDKMDASGLLPLEPALRAQPLLGLGSSAVRSLQLLPTTRCARVTGDVRCRVRWGDSTVVAAQNTQLQAADVAYDYAVASGDTPLYLSAILALADDAPANTVLPAVTGTMTVGQTLTSTSGTWVGAATITYAYQWTRDGANIAAATAATYVLVSGDVGTAIACNVTASNGSGSNTASSNTVYMVPANTVAPAITGTAQVGNTLSASTGTWTGTSPSFAYQWKRAGSNIANATASTYPVVVADVGSTLTCQVTATVGTASAAATSAATAAVVAVPSAPVNTVLPAVTGSNVAAQTLTCSTGTWTGSPTPTYAYQWLRDGVAIGGATASTRVVSAPDAAAVMTCQVTATNSAGATAAISTPAAGAAPVNLTLPLVMGAAIEGQPLSVSNGAWTSSGPLSFAYQWKRAGSNIGGMTSGSYTLVAADRGQAITCTVTATNAVGSTAATSDPTPAVQGLPANTVAPAITGTAQVGQTLTCSTGTWTGAPTPSYRYQWRRAGVDILPASDSSYVPVAADVGAVLSCMVTASNAIGAVAQVSNNTAAVLA